jgi:hypothetical protein
MPVVVRHRKLQPPITADRLRAFSAERIETPKFKDVVAYPAPRNTE